MIRKLFYTCLAVLVLTNASDASTNRTQRFELLRFDGVDTTTIVYQEELDGECEVVYTYSLISTQADTTAKAVLREPLSVDTSYAFDGVVEIVDSNSIYFLPDSGWFRTPAVDSSILRTYNKLAVSYPAQVWYNNCVSDCLQDPEFEGVKAQRLFYSPKGLYIDYGIKKAYFQEATGLLLIFTDQPRMASGMDTMHGVLLYRIVR